MKLEVRNLCLKTEKKILFNNISIDFESGDMVSITGKSGSGKTTLLNCLGLIKNSENGSIYIDGKNMTNKSDRCKTKFWKNYASFIYQDYGIIDEESVYYNVALSENKSSYKKVVEILESLELEDRINDKAIVLSGGEKQRIGIARSIYKTAKIIFADEPTASLDDKNRELVINMLLNLSKKGVLVIIATHDQRLVEKCNKVINLENYKK